MFFLLLQVKFHAWLVALRAVVRQLGGRQVFMMILFLNRQINCSSTFALSEYHCLVLAVAHCWDFCANYVLRNCRYEIFSISCYPTSYYCNNINAKVYLWVCPLWQQRVKESTLYREDMQLENGVLTQAAFYPKRRRSRRQKL